MFKPIILNDSIKNAKLIIENSNNRNKTILLLSVFIAASVIQSSDLLITAWIKELSKSSQNMVTVIFNFILSIAYLSELILSGAFYRMVIYANDLPRAFNGITLKWAFKYSLLSLVGAIKQLLLLSPLALAYVYFSYENYELGTTLVLGVLIICASCINLPALSIYQVGVSVGKQLEIKKIICLLFKNFRSSLPLIILSFFFMMAFVFIYNNSLCGVLGNLAVVLILDILHILFVGTIYTHITKGEAKHA